MERICAHTWDWGDYIPEVWEDWLAEEQGIILVGELQGQVVALNHVSFQECGQVWLEAMRVDPGYRRRGIAGRFLDHSVAYAREQGARVVRLGTSGTNTAIHIMTARASMDRVGAYVLRTAEALACGAELTFLTPKNAACVEAYLADSPVLAHTRGLYSADWSWQELSVERVTRFLDAGQVAGLFTLDGDLRALTTIHAVAEDKKVWIGFADGQPEAVTDLVSRIRGHAAQMGAERVDVMLPDVPWLCHAFQAAGFGVGDWDGELWIFERWLNQSDGDGHDG